MVFYALHYVIVNNDDGLIQKTRIRRNQKMHFHRVNKTFRLTASITYNISYNISFPDYQTHFLLHGNPYKKYRHTSREEAIWTYMVLQ